MARYQKTATGKTILQQAGAPLSALQRATLLMVDGQRVSDVIAKNLSALGDVVAALDQLREMAYIEPVNISTSTTASTATTTSSGPNSETRRWEENRYHHRAAVTKLVRGALENALGPDANALMLKLEKSREAHQFSVNLETALNVLGKVKGEAARIALAEDIHHLPQPT
jgi:hypothetical protein